MSQGVDKLAVQVKIYPLSVRTVFKSQTDGYNIYSVIDCLTQDPGR